MYSYHRLWLSMLVLAILTTTMCGFANEVEISETTDLKHDAHHLDTQAAATLKEMTDGGGGGTGGGGGGGSSSDLSVDLHRSLRFEPAQLDFGTWSVGTVQSHTVTLVNQNRNRSVYLSAVSGRTSAFYSLFTAKMVPPNGNITFDVVFLPREQGAVSTSLHIHTSFGKLRLMVRGEGRECPYRLKPLVGIKAPLNATLMPVIHMYNPHEKTLEILEIYSSGGKFKLELPNGDSKAPQDIWEIPPFTTKSIIRIRFQGFSAGNHSAYIRIKIAKPHDNSEDDGDDDASSSPTSSSSTEQVLVIPVEFEILPEYGLYAVNPLLDFGYLAIDEDATKPFKQKLILRHSKSQLELNNLQFESITHIRGVVMAGGSGGDGDDGDYISHIAIDPQDIMEPVKRLNEKLELVLKETRKSTDEKATTAVYTYHNVELIIRAHIFKGSLHYDANSTMLPQSAIMKRLADEVGNGVDDAATAADEDDELDKKELEKDRHIMLRNDFQIPLAIYNISTTPRDDSLSKLSLQLVPFERGLVLQPGLSLDLLVAFRLAKKQQQEDLKDLTRNYKTAIYVYTNITNFQIPIVISSTRLFVTTQTMSIWRSNNSVYTKELQLSSIPLREMSHKGYIILQNQNSIPIKLNNWDFQKAPGIYLAVQFLGCIKAAAINKSNDYTIDLKRSQYTFNSQLQEGDIAAFELNLQPYTTELNTAYLNIATSYENITIAIKFSIVLGKLEVDQEKLHFANCFPGKLCSSELSIRSTFKQAINMKSIYFSDPGLRFEDKNPHGSKIAPHSVTTVGRIFFEPSALCGSRCYIPQQTDEASSFPSLLHMQNVANVPHFDEVELRRRIELYRHFKYYFQNLDFTMTTKEQQHFQLNLMIEIQWPQLVTGRQVMPTIEVNKTQIFEVKISNPSDQPILMDYLLADPLLAKQTQISLPLEVIILTPSCYLTDKSVFSLVSQPPKKPILIPALSSIRVPIKFQANSMGNYCTLLHIRNNLTLYEGVWISAKAVQSQFRLGNRKPGSPTPLLFEITEQQLNSACVPKEEGSEKKQTHPQVFSRRVFTARISGELPIWIESFWIGDQPCKGYGFQVMDCKSFELKANSSKVIEIIFQTDFTVTRISKTLTLKTNLSYVVSYTLVAQLPSKGLDQCNALLVRPPWEEKIRNATIVTLMVTFVLVLIAVHIDYGNIMYNQSSLYEAREKGHIHPTFNLRNIAMRSSNSQNNNESIVGDGELNQRNKAGLKKRNVAKNQKLSNGEAAAAAATSSSSFAALQNTMTLAEMVSWTFGSKTTKKSYKTNKGKEQSSPTPAANSNTTAVTAADVKAAGKLNEKSLMDKMDEDLKKAQTCTKRSTKITDKTTIKTGSEDQKQTKDDLVEREMKKEKTALVTARSQTKQAADVNSGATGNCSPKEQRKSVEINGNTAQVEYQESQPKTTSPAPVSPPRRTNLAVITPMTEITNQHTPLLKDVPNGRKLGKTPGRERRKQSAQNTSPATSSCSSASTSSSSCSSSQPHPAATSKRYERKSKNKASNSLKFSPNTAAAHHLPNSFYSPAAMAAAANGNNDQTFSSDVLSPWDCSSHITFSDVLQQTQQFANAQAAAAMNSSPTTLLNTDLMQHSATSPSASSSQNLSQQFSSGFENSEITATLTPKKPLKPMSNDLGPIGSRKSPSSTPVWEPLNSAITIQLPRPLNTTTSAATTTSAPLPYDLPALSSNFGYNDLMTARQTIQQIAASSPSQHQHQHQHQQQQQQQQHQQKTQHEFDIAAKLRAIKAHEVMRLQHLLLQQQQQQQQQYLNYTQAINNNWTLPSSTWTPFIGNNTAGGNVMHPTDVYAASTVATPSSAWSLSPVPGSSTPMPMGLMPTAPSTLSGRAEQQQVHHQHHHHHHHQQQQQQQFPVQHLPITSDGHHHHAPSLTVSNSNSAVVAPPQRTSSSSSSSPTFDGNGNAAAINGTSNVAEHNAAAADNMPMFNLFGGLSSIWNDNWKQSTQQQQQQQQQSQQPPSPKSE